MARRIGEVMTGFFAILGEAASTPGLVWLGLGAALAGLVRGFSGFGTAMIFLPIAGQVVPPVWALAIMGVMDAVGPLPLVPRALRDGHPRDVLRLALGLILLLPVGVFLLSVMAPATFRYAVSIITLILLAALVAGVRYRGTLRPNLVVGTGAIGGFLAGSTGLAGPPVIMLYMASTLPVAAIRANILLFLLLADLAMLAVLALAGLLTLEPVIIGALMVPPYLLANLAGAAMFRPERARAYRAAAYVIIAVSALAGLPLWD